MLRSAFLVVVLLVIPVAARAGNDPVTQSRLEFEAGDRLYQAGHYEEALREFQAGYKLAARPPFLINIGQCLRMLHRLRESRAAFARFLVDAPDKDPRRKGVEQLIAELDRELARLPPEPEPPPAAPPTSAPAAPATSAPAAPATSAPATTAPAPGRSDLVSAPPPRKHGIRKYWWTIPLTVTVAAGVAVGLGLGLTARSCPSGDLCVVADGPR